MSSKLYLALMFLVTSCGNKSDELESYGVSLNDDREAAGLPKLQSDWVPIVSFSGKQITWNSPREFTKGIPQHTQKVVTWNEAGIVSEQDTFISGEWVSLVRVDPDSSYGWEELVMRFIFENQSWECFWKSDKGLKVISKSKAQELKVKWKLK